MFSLLFRRAACLLAAASLLLVACNEDDAPVEPDRQSPSNAGVFRGYWEGVDRNYQFFDQFPLDWDNARQRFESRVTEELTDRQLFAILADMSEGIRDHHFTILGFDTAWSPADQILRESIYLDPGYYRQFLAPRYLGPEGVVVPEWGVVYGNIVLNTPGGPQQVQYVHLEDFSLTTMARQRPTLLDSLLTFIQNPAANTRGIIVDMRANTGGSVNDLSLFAGSMLPGNTRVADTRTRFGNNRTEYGPWVPLIAYAAPRTNTLPAVVLTDRWTISMAEITTMALSTRSNVTVLGTTTLGAQGPYSFALDNDLGGVFELPNGWLVIAADRQTRALDGQIYEGRGLRPDVTVLFDLDLLQEDGFDSQLNAGINRLLNVALPTSKSKSASASGTSTALVGQLTSGSAVTAQPGLVQGGRQGIADRNAWVRDVLARARRR